MSNFKQIATDLGLPLVLFGSSLAWSATSTADFPAGVFKASGAPYALSFDGKGGFEVNQGQTLEVKGQYTVDARELHLTDSAGPWACTKQKTGTYRWAYESGALRLNLVSDSCVDRVNSLVNLVWKRE